MIRTWIGPLVTAAVAGLIAGPAMPVITPRVAAKPLETVHQAAVTRPEAHLLASCSGDGCQGKMAAAQGCQADRVQVGGFTRSASDDGREAELNITLWHSPECNSAWAELDLSTHNDSPDYLNFSWIDEYGRGAEQFENESITDPGNHPTPMVSWHNSIQVCIDSDMLHTGLRCSGWR
ncbi:DUF2690 domain-containing protein [Sphaerisporangium corydalis]|uniref:DUF2690 domain-containing protein n=1 Tax=Sphaerisporangium corydalis TaxID=1441875 RepID=A0ABV9EDX2_9ACTN|nr:DUF2690 domain-containing protein [Sphaerisporangium corydalis]